MYRFLGQMLDWQIYVAKLWKKPDDHPIYAKRSNPRHSDENHGGISCSDPEQLNTSVEVKILS